VLFRNFMGRDPDPTAFFAQNRTRLPEADKPPSPPSVVCALAISWRLDLCNAQRTRTIASGKIGTCSQFSGQ
jgi:hypothetical protein